MLPTSPTAKEMNGLNPQADIYFTDGCGRCALGGTPDCKVNLWVNELEYLRGLVLDCGLTEELKWGVPCYTFRGSNVVLIGAFKDNCTLSFFKGALLEDAHGILQKPGEQTQSGRVIRFTNVHKIIELEDVLKAYIFEAVEVEKAGLKVETKKPSEDDFPEELLQKMEEMPALKAAFYALTPGRQRGYLLHFSAAKQSKTRESRIEKCLPQIFKGKGMGEF